MSRSRAARTAVVCTLVFKVTIAVSASASAERRPVAVVDLSDSADGEKLAKELVGALNTHEDLRPIDDAQSQAAMIGAIVDEDAGRIADEQKSKLEADAALRRGDFPRAATLADNAMKNLASFGAPAPALTRLYGELAFIAATARLGGRQPVQAAELFRLVRAVHPQFKPDPAQTFPEVIEAFEAALAQPGAPGTLAVNGSGRIYVDGKDQGKDAPTWLAEVPAGLHVVWLVGPERDPRGRQEMVLAGKKVEVTIEDAPTSTARLVGRARVTLKRASPPFASDPAARAAAILHLAKKVNARDAILVTGTSGKLVIQTWRDRAPGFAPPHEVKQDAPKQLLEPLAPPRQIAKPEPGDPQIREPKPPIVVKRWYQKPRYFVGGPVATIALVVIGVVVYGAVQRDSIGVDQDMGFRN